MAAAPTARRPPNWTPAEVAALSELSGDLPVPLLLQRYNRWAADHGFPIRTTRSILLKANKTGLSLRAIGTWMTSGSIAAVLGINGTTVEGWLHRFPDLPRRHFGSTAVHYVRRDHLRRWARRHMHLFGGIDRSQLVMLLEDEALADQILERFPHRAVGVEATALPVRCLDDGRTWPSIKAAAKAIYVTHSALWAGLKHGHRVAGLRFTVDHPQAAAPQS